MITKEFDDLYLLHPTYPAKFEQYIYSAAEMLSQNDAEPYSDGHWKSVPIEKGWCLELQDQRTWCIVNENNFSVEILSTEAFSIVVFLKALSSFYFFLYEKSKKGENISELMDELTNLHSNIQLSIQNMIKDIESEVIFQHAMDELK